MAVGDNIKRIRKEKKLTQKRLGELCNPPMSDSLLRRYEAGKANPKIETIQRIAAALEVPFTELLTIKENGITSYDFTFADNEEELEKAFKAMPHYRENNNADQEAIEQAEINTLWENLEKSFDKLNVPGKQKAVEQIDLLTRIPEYKK